MAALPLAGVGKQPTITLPAEAIATAILLTGTTAIAVSTSMHRGKSKLPVTRDLASVDGNKIPG